MVWFEKGFYYVVVTTRKVYKGTTIGFSMRKILSLALLAALAVAGCSKDSKEPTKYERVADYFRKSSYLTVKDLNGRDTRIGGVTTPEGLKLRHKATESELFDRHIDGVVDNAEYWIGNTPGKTNGNRAFSGLIPQVDGDQFIYDTMIDAALAEIEK